MKNHNLSLHAIRRNRLRNTSAAAEYLGLSPFTLRNWRHQNQGPNWIKVGRIPMYDPTDLNSFIDSNRVVVSD